MPTLANFLKDSVANIAASASKPRSRKDVILGIESGALKAAFTLVAIVAAYACALLSSHLVRRAVDRYQRSQDKDSAAGSKSRRAIIFSILGSLVFWVVFSALLVVILSVVGVRTAALAALFGSVLFAVGLGLQGTLGDLASGVMLLAANTYTIGDFIEADKGAVRGRVVDFNVLFTRVHNTATNTEIIVPNRVLYGGTLVNYSMDPLVAASVDIAAANTNSPRLLSHILETIVENVHRHPAIVQAEGVARGAGIKEPVVACEVGSVTPFATMINVRFQLALDAYITHGTVSVQNEITTIARNAVIEAGGRLASPGGAASAADQGGFL